jgi:hypothetical protein
VDEAKADAGLTLSSRLFASVESVRATPRRSFTLASKPPLIGRLESVRAWLGRLVVKTAWSWVDGWPWTCPRCLLTVWTKEAGPRCPRCSFREGS